MKSFRPTSPAIRKMTIESFEGLEKSRPPKQLLSSKPSKGGKNSHGHTTVRFRGGGHKRLYRIVSFRRKHEGIAAKVTAFYYDPNRSARLALLTYENGDKALILAPQGLQKGDKVETGPQADIKPGNALPLANIPVGSVVHCVELYPGRGAQIARSAGTSVQYVGKEGKYAQIKMPSGELRMVPLDCYATLGAVGNQQHEGRVIGKAGKSRWLGRRPHNRGTTMNPVDHPHGGGEGRTAGGRNPVTPWGKPTKGYKTRTNKRTNHLIIRGRPRGKMTGAKK